MGIRLKFSHHQRPGLSHYRKPKDYPLSHETIFYFIFSAFFFLLFPIQFTCKSKESRGRLPAFNAWWWWWFLGFQLSSVQSLSHVRLSVTPCYLWLARQASLSITNSLSLLKLTSTESVMPSNYLILCSPLLLLHLIFPSTSVFSNESFLHIGWPKYWSLVSTSVLPMNIQDWFPLEWMGWISLLSKGLSRVFSNTAQKYKFFRAQLSLWSNSHIYTWWLEET